MEIKLSRRTFEALVSETRIEILRMLDRRPMTVSEIARELGIAKSAAHEHLAKLVEAELVERVEGQRKWVYYRLTPQGVGILHPEMKYRLLVLLGSGVLALMGGAGMLLRTLYPRAPAEVAPPAEVPSPAYAPAGIAGEMKGYAGGYGGAEGANLSAPPPPPHPAWQLPEHALAWLLLILGALLLLLWYRKRRALQKRYIR